MQNKILEVNENCLKIIMYEINYLFKMAPNIVTSIYIFMFRNQVFNLFYCDLMWNKILGVNENWFENDIVWYSLYFWNGSQHIHQLYEYLV